MNPLRLRLEWLLLLAVALAVAIWGQWSEAAYRIDNRALDIATSLARPSVDPDIVIVAIDDPALAEIGAWPWPRSTHARLVEALDAAGAKLVLFDVLFVEPTTTEDDTALADAIAQAGHVVLPHTFGLTPNTADAFQPVMPLPSLGAAAAGIGHVGAELDNDGLLRRFTLEQPLGEAVFPHFVAVGMEELGLPTPYHGAPEDAGNRPIIPFQPIGAFPTISAAEVLQGRLLEGALTGKIVLVGATSAGLGDRYSVAAGTVELMPGVETQANLLNALMAQRVVTPMGMPAQLVVSVVSLVLLFLAFWFLPPRYGLVSAVALLALLLVGTIAMVPLTGQWLPIGALALVILLAYPLWSWRRLTAVSTYLDNEARRLVSADRGGRDEEGVDFIARQVSRVRRLVHNVQDSLAFLRQVIEAAPDAIIVLDSEGHTQMMNARAQSLFAAWREGDAPSLQELLLEVQARLRQDRGEIETADGKTFLLARAQLGSADAPSRSGEILALREVTEIRRREEERKQMLEFLSHDMRTPQAAIIGLASRANGEPDTGKLFKRIRNQAERTLKLADDFVQLARLEEAEISREDTDLVALSEEACDRFFAQARARKITIAQDLPEEPVYALVDASLIARLLDNLIGNALKYSPAETSVHVSVAKPADGTVALTIADEGPGLSEERQANPFARFGAHEQHAGPSAGLGLAFVKRVVDTHGGVIDVKSEAGQGTRFVVTLPAE
ncbi:CHASE2 and HATPase_c domain-containing protein [Parerythrobacter aestuarii]|uniref:CHASE2 and HATPase_c domain-containing protein n=1 Tax=Parerythrobacter aestuarii TaxID=3020909 RepID=UPI0024DE3F80|nr:CHASE2 and HATPase_c domain-containing protein [Parerythrobacter aestuarii]